MMREQLLTCANMVMKLPVNYDVEALRGCPKLEAS